MFLESQLLPLSGLQHLIFCERQWGLIHVEQVWAENRFTAEGRVLHERSHTTETEVRGELRIARSLRIHSLWLGLAGVADVVEFHNVKLPDATSQESKIAYHVEAAFQFGTVPHRLPMTVGHSMHRVGHEPAIRLPGVAGLWRPMPVEYKRGRPKRDRCDEIQLCAQALCLEEMLAVTIPEGALYYGKIRRRLSVLFDDLLRSETIAAAQRMHEFFDRRETPHAVYGPRCLKCSLYDLCQPKATGNTGKLKKYVAELLNQ